ncbi:MAG: DUF417 family protein [bacterium]|nr:DUF417 family protein [bacterium]
MKKINLSIKILRISLGVIFLWFGLLKFSSYNPVFDILNASFPFLASGVGLKFLAAFETLIGLGLLFNVLPRLVHIVLVVHLLGTFSVFFSAPELMFNQAFPFLTLAGEFVAKNIVLLAAGLVVLECGKQNKNSNG